MPADRRIFSVLDTDTAPENVPNGKAAAMLNVQPERDYNRTVRGNRLVAAQLPVGLNTAIGWARIPGSGGLVWLNHNSEGAHHLVRWIPRRAAAPELLLTWPGLNLPLAQYVPVSVLGDFVLFLDAEGESRSVPMPRALAGVYTPQLLAAEPYALHLLKVPPLQAPVLERLQEATVVGNQLEGQAVQAATRWRYLDGETTVFSPFSAVSDAINQSGGDLRNVVRITFAELLPALVEEVELLLRFNGESEWVLAERWQRSTGFVTSYDFVGPTSGEVIPAADATRSYDALWPAKAQTVAQNRVWNAHVRIGYKTSKTPLVAFAFPRPLGESLQVIYKVAAKQRYQYGNTTQRISVVRRFALFSGLHATASARYVEVDYSGHYAETINTTPVPELASTVYHQLNQAPLTYQQAFVDKVYREESGTRVVSAVGVRRLRNSLVGARTLHSGGTYAVSLEFYDALGRPGGASPPFPITVPAQNYGFPEPQQVRWRLPVDGLDENEVIPAWASSYALLLGRNATVSTFRQGPAADVLAYLGRDAENEPILVSITAAHAKVWVDIGTWPAQEQGYVWTKESGDRLRFVQENLDFLIQGQYGDYLEIEWTGAPSAQRTVLSGYRLDVPVEIYTPAAVVSDTVLYQSGPRYSILRTTDEATGETRRSFSITEGALEGDAWLSYTRWSYIGFDTNTGDFYNLGRPNDEVYNNNPPPIKKAYSHSATFMREQMAPLARPNGAWLDASRGRAAVVLPLSLQQKELPTTVQFSDVLLAGTQTNGLSSWQPLNQRDLPTEIGAIQALQLAADNQAQGSVLLALGTEAVESLYLGRGALRQSGGGSNLVVEVDRVIGSTTTLTGGYGTRHPRTVVQRKGRVWWWDEANATVCRYAADGINDLCEQNACVSLGQELAATYAGAAAVGGYDPESKEYVLSFAPGRTIRFAEVETRRGFVGDVSYVPEGVLGTKEGFYSFQAGQVWEHTDAAPRLTFYGITTPARLSVWANELGNYSKTWQALVIEGGRPLWELTEARTQHNQRTRLPASRMEWLEDKYYGALLNDENSPGFAADPKRAVRALYEGVPVQGTALRCTFTCADTTDAARLVAVTLTYILNSGQTAPA